MICINYNCVIKYFFRLEWQTEQGKLKVQRKKHNRKSVVKIPTVQKGNMKKFKYRRKSGKVEKPGRSQRSISLNHYVETLIVADASMVDFHQDGDIETYILTLMNMVRLYLFRKPISKRKEDFYVMFWFELKCS